MKVPKLKAVNFHLLFFLILVLCENPSNELFARCFHVLFFFNKFMGIHSRFALPAGRLVTDRFRNFQMQKPTRSASHEIRIKTFYIFGTSVGQERLNTQQTEMHGGI